MEKLGWIKDLVRAEMEMEESGMVDLSAGFSPEDNVLTETVEYLHCLKAGLVEGATAFNNLKGSTVGRIKIYGISNTEADFMLFRNGFKLVFAMLEPGRIAVRFHQMGTRFLPGQSQDEGQPPQNEDILEGQWGAFGNLIWTFQEQEIKLDYLVRYYLTRFIRESAR